MRKQKMNQFFHSRLDALIQSRGESNGVVGAAVGVSHVQIGKYRRTQMPSGDVLYRLSRHLGVSMEYLLADEEDAANRVRESPSARVTKADIQAIQKKLEAAVKEAFEGLAGKF